MNFTSLFEEFWNKEHYYLSVNNPTRFHDSLASKMADFTSIGEIDEYYCSILQLSIINTKG